METPYILIESFKFNNSKGRFLLNVPNDGLRINVDCNGYVQVLKPEQKCHLCNGSGGAIYWYAQDESTAVDCPICGKGNQVKWDREKERYEKFIKDGGW